MIEVKKTLLTSFVILCLLSTVFLIGHEPSVEASNTTSTAFEIIATFDAPGDSQHGLAWDGTYLWMLDARRPFKLYKIHPSNGSTVQEFNIDDQLIGLAYVNGYLWGCVGPLPDALYKYDLSGNYVAGPYYTPYGAPQGLAYDGTYLWIVYNTAIDEITTTTLPPDSDTFVLRFYSPTVAPYGLAWINGYLWLSGTETIYKIDPADGHVVESFTDYTHFSYTSGITFDGLGYLWVVDNSKDKLYKVNVGIAVTANVDIDPDTLNLKSNGKWITCYIELPEGYDVSHIDVSTIMLSDTIPAEAHPTEVGDYDEDTIPDVMVKFNRAEVMALLSVGEATLTIAGEVNDTLFEGSDTIRAIDE